MERVSKGTAVVGGFLKIHPIVSVEEGELKIIGKSRGNKKAQNTVIEKVAENIAGYLEQNVGIAYNGSMKPVEEYESALRLMGVKKMEPVPIGCVLAGTFGSSGNGDLFSGYTAGRDNKIIMKIIVKSKKTLAKGVFFLYNVKG